jgi:hypothetical protein
MGRPKIGTQNAKGVFLSIRLTPPEAEQINCAAKRLGLTKSQYGRKILLSSLSDVGCQTKIGDSLLISLVALDTAHMIVGNHDSTIQVLRPAPAC